MISLSLQLQEANEISGAVKEISVYDREKEDELKEKQKRVHKKGSQKIEEDDATQTDLANKILADDPKVRKEYTEDQFLVMKSLARHFSLPLLQADEQSCSKSLQLLILGGPGTGKTYIINQIKDLAQGRRYTYSILSNSITLWTNVICDMIDHPEREVYINLSRGLYRTFIQQPNRRI